MEKLANRAAVDRPFFWGLGMDDALWSSDGIAYILAAGSGAGYSARSVVPRTAANHISGNALVCLRPPANKPRFQDALLVSFQATLGIFGSTSLCALISRLQCSLATQSLI